MPGNLTNGPDSATQDFATSAWRIRQLGFNAVRLPFRFRDLAKGEAGGPGAGVAPYPYTRLCGAPSPDMLKTTVAPPVFESWLPRALSRAGAPLRLTPDDPPEVPTPAGATKSLCNAPLARTRTVRDRFHYVVAELVAQGFAVMVDYHPGLRIATSEVALDDLPGWVDAWEATLSRLLAAVPGVRGRLLVDLINEPDAYNIRWEAANGNPGLTDLYLRALDRLYPACPNCLFVIEGTGQSAAKANWGDGFITNKTTIKEFGGKVSDATPFFEAAVAKPWAKQAVLAPHIYCPSSSKAIDGFRGQEMYDRLDNSFGGKIRAPGYCNADGVCHQFAAIVGETSNNFWTGGQNERDCWVSFFCWSGNEREGEEAGRGWPPPPTRGRTPNSPSTHCLTRRPSPSLPFPKNSLASYYGRGDFSGFFYWGWNSNSADTGACARAREREAETEKERHAALSSAFFPIFLIPSLLSTRRRHRVLQQPPRH